MWALVGNLILLLGWFITGNCMVLTPITPLTVRVREGEILTLEAHVVSDETNLRFSGPGEKIIIGPHDHRYTTSGEVLGEADYGYLLSIKLTIWHIDRFQSGLYTLKGFDAYSNERIDWTVIVQVVPDHYMTTPSQSPCVMNDDNDELRCAAYNPGDVTWNYCGCNVTLIDADNGTVSEFDQCDGLYNLNFFERYDSLSEAAKIGDLAQASMLVILGTPVKDIEPSILGIAARMGHLQLSKLLLNFGSIVKAPTYPNVFPESYNMYAGKSRGLRILRITPLHCAAWSGSVQLVEEMLARGAELNAKEGRDNDGIATISFAAMSGSISLVKKLVSLGEDPNYKDVEGRTPVFYASLSGSVQLVKLFKRLGADLFSTDKEGNSLLFLAAKSGSLHLVQFLVSLGLEPLKENNHGETPVVQASLGGSMSVLEVLLNLGGNISFVDTKNRTLLHFAAATGQTAMVERLVQSGLDVTFRDTFNSTPLHYAVLFVDRPSLVRTLISSGGNPDANDTYGATPLHLAAGNALLLSVEGLLSAGANANAADNEGNTPLHRAVHPSARIELTRGMFKELLSGCQLALQIVQTLVRSGGNVNVANKFGKTPLHLAVQGPFFWRVVDGLLKAGANPNAADAKGFTPLHEVVAHKDYSTEVKDFSVEKKDSFTFWPTFEALVEAGANLSAADERGWTPLHVTAHSGNLHFAEALIEAGASFVVVDKEGKTPLDVAKKKIRDKKEGSFEHQVVEWFEGLEA